MDKFTDNEVAERLSALPGWELSEGHIVKTYEFTDFRTAMDFMNQLVPVIEELNHHPDWSNVYNKVRISLFTHDEDSLTEKDFALAAAAEKAAAVS